jgi:WD40 repeat protein
MLAYVAMIGLALLGADAPQPLEVAAPTRAEPVSYAREVSEFLAERCVGCHSEALAEKGLNLESVAAMAKGGKGGPALVPGKSAESRLFTLAAHRAEPVMPPRDKPQNKPLTPKELGLLQRWIDEGAKDDSDGEAPAPAPITLGALPAGVQPVEAIDVTGDGKLVAFGRGDRVVVAEVATGKELANLSGHKDVVQSVRFDPKGTRLAAGSYQIVTLWDVPTGEAPAKGEWPEPRTFGPHVFRVLALDFAPDGALLATGGGEPSRSGEVKVWEVATGKLALDLPALHSDTVFGVRFAPDGKALATASADKFAKVVALPDGKLRLSLEGHTNHAMGVDWKADGTELVTAGADNVVKLWDAAGGEQKRTFNAAGKALTGVRWVAGKPLVLAGSGDAVTRAWNPENGGVVRTFGGVGEYALCVAASADGKVVAAGGADGAVLLWNGETGALLRKLEPPAAGAAKP